MKIISIAAVALALCLLATSGPLALAAAPETPPVQVRGEVPPRPELETITGVRGWVVNGQQIPLDVVRDRTTAYYGPNVLQDMVADVLLRQEAERRHIQLTEQDVQNKVTQLREDLGIRSDAAFESFLRTQRTTPEWFFDKARSFALMEKVLADQVFVDDREVERYYRAKQEDYRRQEVVAFRVMRFLDKASADAALGRLRQGESFEKLAEGAAPTPAEKAVAGELQYYERGQQTVPPEFEAALFAAPLNQVTGPVDVRGSFYLIRVEKKIDPHQYTLDEIKDVIRTQLRKQKLEQVVWPNWIRDQLSKAQIQVLVAKPPAPSAGAPSATPEDATTPAGTDSAPATAK